MKMNKKGFTIVELVIVIAVIAILAGVMIPTFGGVIDNANKTTAQQEAANIYKQMSAELTNINKGKTFTDAEFVIVLLDENDEETYSCKVVKGEVATAVAYSADVHSGYTENTGDNAEFTVPAGVKAKIYYKLAE